MRIKFTAIAAVSAGLLILCSCGNSVQQTAAAMTGGDPMKGKAAIDKYGCGSCHTIQGIRDAKGLVGPPLTGIASRVYIAGILKNQPANLQHWIRNPRSVNEKTAMPVLGVTEGDARDIASYLYTLK